MQHERTFDQIPTANFSIETRDALAKGVFVKGFGTYNCVDTAMRAIFRNLSNSDHDIAVSAAMQRAQELSTHKGNGLLLVFGKGADAGEPDTARGSLCIQKKLHTPKDLAPLFKRIQECVDAGKQAVAKYWEDALPDGLYEVKKASGGRKALKIGLLED